MNSEAEDDNNSSNDRWLVSYADFITLLFAFFTVLYATSERNLEKTEKVQESFKKYLIKGGGSFGGSADTVNQGEKFNTPIEPPIPTFQKGNQEAENTLSDVETELESLFAKEDVKKYILDVASDEMGVRIVLKGGELFADDAIQFRPGAMPFLKQLGTVLSRYNKKFLIEGHSQSHNSTYSNEWEFASARAITLVRYFAKVHKIDNARLISMSYGNQRPMDPSKTKQPMLNERLELVILNGDSPL